MDRSIYLLAVVGVLAFAACSDDTHGAVSDGSASPDKGGDEGIKPPICIAPPCPPTYDGVVTPRDSTVEGATPDAKFPPDTVLCPPLPQLPAECLGTDCKGILKPYPGNCFLAYCGGMTEHDRVAVITCVSTGGGK